MTLVEYLPVLIQILLAVGMGFGILFASHLFGQKATAGKIKDSPYECGLASEVKGETRYSVKFYVTAMLFILFDIDVVFLIPWVLTHRDFVAAGIPILWPMLFFTFILVVGLIYELKKRCPRVGEVIISCLYPGRPKGFRLDNFNPCV